MNDLIMNRAVWHKSCHFKFSQDRLDGEKRKRLRNDWLPARVSPNKFVSMLLYGSNLRDQDSTDSETCLTIPQVIVFNSKKRGSTLANSSRHSLEYEPPLPRDKPAYPN